MPEKHYFIKKRNFYLRVLGGAFFLLVFWAGFKVAQHSLGGRVYVSLNTQSPSRGLASLNKEGGALSSGEHLPEKRHEALVKSSSSAKKDGGVEFYLGSFLVRSPQGDVVPVCSLYKTLDLEFMAVDVSVHGHVPKLVMKTQCHRGEKGRLGPFLIPTEKILSTPLNQPLFRTQRSTLLFSHVSIVWPLQWVMVQARFLNHQNQVPELTVAFPAPSPQTSLFLEF